MGFEINPPTNKSANTDTQFQPLKKQGFWNKTTRVVSTISTKIHRGFKWLTSLPQKIHHTLRPNKELVERSIEKKYSHLRKNKNTDKSDNDKHRKKKTQRSIDLLIHQVCTVSTNSANTPKTRKRPASVSSDAETSPRKLAKYEHPSINKDNENHTPSTTKSPMIADSLKPYRSPSENPGQQRLTGSSDSDFDEYISSDNSDSDSVIYASDSEDDAEEFDYKSQFKADDSVLVPFLSDTDTESEIEFEVEMDTNIDSGNESDFEDDDDNSLTPYFTNRKKRYRKKQRSQRITTYDLTTGIQASRIKSRPISDKQLDDLANELTNRRKLIQKFIADTQVAFLRYGPNPTSTLSELQEIEESSLNFIRELLSNNTKAKMHPKISDIVNALKQDISGLKKFVEDAEKYDFRSGHQHIAQIETYEQLVQKLAHKEKNPLKRTKILKQAMSIINDLKSTGQFDSTPAECISDNIDVLLELDNALRKIFPDSQVFDKELIEILSKDSRPFQTRLQVYLDGKWKEISTTYTPAAAMRLHDTESFSTRTTGTRDPFEHTYEGKLAPSMQRNTRHAVNMMGYSMKIDGQQVTSQVRVGCPYAYAEKNSEDRKKVSLDRVKEIFTALLVQNHSDKLQNAIRDPEHPPIQLDAVYMNLLSPDNIRNNPLMNAIGQDDEKRWVKKIHKMLKELSGKEMELKVYLDSGKRADIRIVPNVAMFVVPCNQLALQQPSDSSRTQKTVNHFLRATANTWETVNTVNNEALRWLMGPNGLLNKKLSLLPARQQERATGFINDLQALVKNSKIDFEKIAKQKGPFTFSEILFQLLEVLDIDMFSGCKSNKDRTSIFQTVLQSLLVTHKPIHKSQVNETDEQSPLYALVAELLMVYGGHTEVQKRNTALVGYRLDETPGKDLNKISYTLMRRNPMEGNRQSHSTINNPDLYTPITLKNP